MAFYKLLGPSHYHFGTIHKRGAIIETESDFVAQFPNSFEKVSAPAEALAPVAPATAAPPPAKVEGAAPKAPALVTALAARGTDVTVNFPKTAAQPEGFRVFARGDDAFHVFVGDALTPINAKALKAAQVDAAVEKYLG